MAKPLTTVDIVTEFDVLCQKNHGGTFNEFIEAVTLWLEQYINNKVKELIPDVVLDYRISLNTSLEYLFGQQTHFIVKGTRTYFICIIND
jgi:hypothetical protein